MFQRIIFGLGLLIALWPLLAVRAEVRALTLGITMNCPYGLGGCWLGVREGLARLPDVEFVDERPSAPTQTCQIRMRDGGLPNLRALARSIGDRRAGAILRGVEATVDGQLMEQSGELLLKFSGSHGIVRLAPLRHKVQWEWPARREQPPTPEERTAYARLRAQKPAGSATIRIVGPLVEEVNGDRLALEVRNFALPR